ncbi:MAG: hypothetical protein GY754_43695 [bacterium]|nr:hypothetical protein [bacterium]
MNTKMDKWTFPEQVSITDVPLYDKMLKEQEKNNQIVFDLRNTSQIHASFIGFLLEAKAEINQRGNEFILLLSATLEGVFYMLNLFDYFSSEIFLVFNER